MAGDSYLFRVSGKFVESGMLKTRIQAIDVNKNECALQRENNQEKKIKQKLNRLGKRKSVWWQVWLQSADKTRDP